MIKAIVLFRQLLYSERFWPYSNFDEQLVSEHLSKPRNLAVQFELEFKKKIDFVLSGFSETVLTIVIAKKTNKITRMFKIINLISYTSSNDNSRKVKPLLEPRLVC